MVRCLEFVVGTIKRVSIAGDEIENGAQRALQSVLVKYAHMLVPSQNMTRPGGV